MSTVHDITDALADSATLHEIAKRAGITLAQARSVAGMFADLNVTTAIRIMTVCQHDRIRQSERQARMKR